MISFCKKSPIFAWSDLNKMPKDENNVVDDSKDFFGKKTSLTVSGQLEAELAAMAFGEVYTFGPTFRAENSNTSRHLSEFWMLEPEIAFATMDDAINLAESILKHCIESYLSKNYEDVNFFTSYYRSIRYRNSTVLITRITS